VERGYSDKESWFPAPKYGFGWGLPVCWQGWAVLLSYFLLIAGGCVFMSRSATHFPIFIAFVTLVTGVFIFICWVKGEKLRWRWGDDK
jgi:hypothetical protein